MILKEYWNPVCVAISIGMFAIILSCIYPLFALSDDATPRIIEFMACHLAGMVICLILFVSVLADQRFTDATYFFMCLISFEFLSLFLEFTFWHTKSYLYNDVLLWIVYNAECLMFPCILYLFGNYERCILDIGTEEFNKFENALRIAFIINAALLLLNVPTEWFFTVDNSSYVANVLNPILFAPPFIMMVICIFIAAKYSTNVRHKVVLLLYVVLPLSTVIMKMPNYSSSVTYLATMITFIFMYGEIYLDRGIRIVKNEAAMTEQRISMMLSRIEPDFLEESLRSISEMEGNPRETTEALDNFITYLDENIESISEKKPIPLSKELEHVKTYVQLEKLRFKDKLNVVFDIRDNEFEIPAMTLQMIVENAIKHGITQREEGGTVTIVTEESETDHIIRVTDDGIGFDPDAPRTTNRSHIGLDSVSKRLKGMLDGTFVVESEIGKGTVATITIPKNN